MRQHWYKPGFWWWWLANEAPPTIKLLAPLTVTGLVLAGGFAAAYALAGGDGPRPVETVVMTSVKVARDVEVVTVSHVVTVPNGNTRTVSKVVYRTRPAKTLPAVTLPSNTVYLSGSTVYRAVTTPGGTKLVTVERPVSVERPVTVVVTRTTTVAGAPETVTHSHVVTTQKLVPLRHTVTAPGRTVTVASTVVQPVTQVSTETDVVTTFVNRPAPEPRTTTQTVTQMVPVTVTAPGTTVTRTVTTPGPTQTETDVITITIPIFRK